MIVRPLLIGQPVTQSGLPPSHDLVQVLQAMAKTINVQSRQIADLEARVTALETP